jgi:fibrillarin-like rRNA methylase
MVYLIGIDNKGNYGNGNHYTVRVANKPHNKLIQAAQNMKTIAPKIERVYKISSYTQNMCEMDNRTFVQYIEKNGIKIL